MAINPANLILYLSANKPTTDGGVSGGAIDRNMRVLLTQLSANAVIGAVSSSAADTTQTLTIVGRDANGNIVSVALPLTGTTEADTVQVFSMIESFTLSGVCAGTVTLKQGAAGATIQTIPVGELGCAILFQQSLGQTTSVARYEKVFAYNSDPGSALLPAASITVDSTTYYGIGVTAALNDTATVANRLQAPAGITFVGDFTAQNGPSPLTSGNQWGIWVRQSLGANPATAFPVFTLQVQSQ